MLLILVVVEPASDSRPECFRSISIAGLFLELLKPFEEL